MLASAPLNEPERSDMCNLRNDLQESSHNPVQQILLGFAVQIEFSLAAESRLETAGSMIWASCVGLAKAANRRSLQP